MPPHLIGACTAIGVCMCAMLGEPKIMESENSFWNRRDFLKVGSTSAASLGLAGTAAVPIQAKQAPAGAPPDTPYPKPSIITPYSPQKLAFAALAGYEGVLVTPGTDSNPNLSDSAID